MSTEKTSDPWRLSDSYSRTPRYRDAVLITTEKIEVELETPIGPRTFTWGGMYGEHYSGTYRGESVMGSTIEKLQKNIARVEEEFQVKAARDKKRKEVAKTPEPAIYAVVIDRDKRWSVLDEAGRTQAHLRAFEAVTVRGVDLRSKKALIVRANGDKEQVRFDVLMRDLDDSTLNDFHSLYQQYQAAFLTNEQSPLAVSSTQVLRTFLDAPLDLEAKRDLVRERVVTTYRGREFVASDTRSLKTQIERWILHEAGYEYEIKSLFFRGSHSSAFNRVIEGEGSLGLVVCTQQEAHRVVELEEAVEARLQAIKEAVSEEAFDRSLVEVPEDVEEQPANEESVTLPNIQAPQHEEDF